MPSSTSSTQAGWASRSAERSATVVQGGFSQSRWQHDLVQTRTERCELQALANIFPACLY
eukprot:5003392-Heterocapsa_arctica.AAC.1